jgi:hypothetical protein
LTKILAKSTAAYFLFLFGDHLKSKIVVFISLSSLSIQVKGKTSARILDVVSNIFFHVNNSLTNISSEFSQIVVLK